MTEPRDPEDARVLALYRRAPAPAPSPELDAAICAAARRAVEHPPGRWRLPALASAAVLVLAVGLVLRLPVEELAPRPGPDASPALESRAPSGSGLPDGLPAAQSPAPLEAMPPEAHPAGESPEPYGAGATYPAAVTPAPSPSGSTAAPRGVSDPELHLPAPREAPRGPGRVAPDPPARAVPAPQREPSRPAAGVPAREAARAAGAGAPDRLQALPGGEQERLDRRVPRMEARPRTPDREAPGAAKSAPPPTTEAAPAALVAPPHALEEAYGAVPWTEDACPSELPAGLADDPEALRRRMAELLEAGRTEEAACLARMLDEGPEGEAHGWPGEE